MDEVDGILAEYLVAFDRGEAPPVEEFLARHPEHRAELAAFLADDEAIDRFAGPSAPTHGVIRGGAEEEAPLEFAGHEILGTIGRGGMGVVYRARDPRLGRVVALKRIGSGRLATEEERRRFETEARAIANLDHPNVIPIHAVGESDGQAWYTMRLVDGPCAADVLGELVASPRRAARLVALVARAVHHMHQRGVLHRDLKPSNILLEGGDHPFVTDFGLARSLEGSGEGTVSGSFLGSPPYMAPEQAGSGAEITTATDVHGIGAVLYAFLTAQAPCAGRDLVEVLARVRTEAPVPPRRLRPGVPLDLETIALRCLEKDPARRYGSAREVAEELERWLDGRPILARPVSGPARLVRWARRRPGAAGLAALAVLVPVLVSVVATWLARSRAERLEEEVLAGDVHAARGAASTLLWQLEGHARGLHEAAGSPAVASALRSGDGERLEALCRELRGGREILRSVFVLDAEGRLLAVDPPNRSVVGRDFARRDYYRGAIEHGLAGRRGLDSVHLSRVFRSENDRLDKFALSAPIPRSEPDRPAGVLALSIATSSALGAIDPGDDRRIAVLVGPRDAAGEDAARVIMLHPAYGEAVEPVALPAGAIPEPPPRDAGPEFRLAAPPRRGEAELPGYLDPAAAVDPAFEGRWLAGWSPVGHTEYLVVVQQRPASVEDDRAATRALVLTVGGGLAVLAAAAGVGLIARRN